MKYKTIRSSINNMVRCGIIIEEQANIWIVLQSFREVNNNNGTSDSWKKREVRLTLEELDAIVAYVKSRVEE